MKRRKRDFGEFVDEETGETFRVETNKAAKRNHQRSGKWYKEPSERELRIWEREDKQRDAADKAKQREQNKKLNAVKRARQQAKEIELKNKLFEEGKITFTQTLAKKSEDQQNLHSWFGGKPKAPAPRPLPAIPTWNSLSPVEEVSTMTPSKEAPVREVQAQNKEAHNLSSQNAAEMGQTKTSRDVHDAKDQVNGACDNDDKFDFEIAEDDDASDLEALDDLLQTTEAKEVEPSSKMNFGTSATPKRIPLSPLSQSDLNARVNNKPSGIKSFEARLEQVNQKRPQFPVAGTQAFVQNLCTQDLNLDLDDEDDDDIESLLDKENDAAAHSIDNHSGGPLQLCRSPTKHSRHSARSVELSGLEVGASEAQSLGSPYAPKTQLQSFGDDDLDDDILLLLPATQIASNKQTTNGTASTRLRSLPFSKNTAEKSTPNDRVSTVTDSKSKKLCDSFAVDGMSDNDLLEGLQDYEKSQQSQPAKTGVTTALASSSGKKKTRSALPWELDSWSHDTGAEIFDDDNDPLDLNISMSQQTEVLG